MMIPIRSCLAPFAAAVALFAASLAPAQQTFAPNDPLGGDRTIARSVEIMALRADPVLLPRLYDASGEADPNFACPPAAGSAFPCDGDGVGVERTAVLQIPPTGYRGLGYDFDGVAADFDGDGKDEFAYAYEAGDGYAYIHIADADDGVLGIFSACCVRAQYPMQGSLHRRPLRVVAGEADGDPTNGLELILAYRFTSAGLPGTAIEYFHVDPSTLEPTRYDATSWSADLNPALACTGFASLVIFDPVFDIALADLDEDGRDEMILAQTARKCVGTSTGSFVDDVISVVVRSGLNWVSTQGSALDTELHVLNRLITGYVFPYAWSGVALAVGNFDASDTRPEIAVTSHRVIGYRWQYASIIGIDQSLVSTFGPEFQLISREPFSGIDRRFDADAMDLDLSGRPELVTADGSDVRIFEVDPSGLFSERGTVSGWASRSAPASRRRVSDAF